jgi:DHA2 family multidrug resistance protein
VGVFSLLLAPISGRLLPRFDTRIVASLSFLGFAGIFFMRSNYLAQIDTFHLVLPTLLQGIPQVLWFIPLTRLILSGLPPERIAAAAGLSNFARIFCGAAGTSVATTLWNNRTILHHERLTEQANVNNPVFNDQISTMQQSLHVDLPTAHALFDSIVTSQAAVMGLDDFFYFSSGVFILMIPLLWLTRPVRSMAVEGVSDAH